MIILVLMRDGRTRYHVEARQLGPLTSAKPGQALAATHRKNCERSYWNAIDGDYSPARPVALRYINPNSISSVEELV